jgi:hypothetical protein
MEQSKKTSLKNIQEVSSPSERACSPSDNAIFFICSLFLRAILACLVLDPDRRTRIQIQNLSTVPGNKSSFISVRYTISCTFWTFFSYQFNNKWHGKDNKILLRDCQMFFFYRPCNACEASTCDREGGSQHQAQTSRQDLI